MTLAEYVAETPLKDTKVRMDRRYDRVVNRIVRILRRDADKGQADIDADRLISLDEAKKRWKLK